jgi:Ca-activated chloride channel family protein
VRRFAAQSGTALLESPALFVGHRTGADDTGDGRRGGGGALFVELLPEPDAIVTIGPNNAAFRIDASWIDPLTREVHGTNAAVMNPLRPGETPEVMDAYFSEPDRDKAYWMLNCYLALRAAVDFQQTGDCARAKGVIDMVQAQVETWLVQNPDDDIQADLDLMLDLRFVLEDTCTATEPIRPQVFDGGCYYS